MAQDASLIGLRNLIVKSLYGRRLGLSYGSPGSTTVVGREIEADFLSGIRGVRLPVVTLTSATTATSTADQIPNSGVCFLNCSSWASTAFNPVSPIPGVSVQLINMSSALQTINVNNSTLTTAVTAIIPPSSAAGGSSAGTAFIMGSYAWAELMGQTTAVWAVRMQMASTVTTGSSQSTSH